MAPRAELSERHYPWQITTLPLWSSHGTLGRLKTWPSRAHSAHKERGRWQILGLAHRGGIHTTSGGWWRWWRGSSEMSKNHSGQGRCDIVLKAPASWWCHHLASSRDRSAVEILDVIRRLVKVVSMQTCMYSFINYNRVWIQSFTGLIAN